MLKRTTFLITLTLLAGLFCFPALAQETEEISDPGILPDSPFYFIKSLFEDVGTFFTFDNLDKAERYQELAQRRIDEIKALAENDKVEESEKALERYRYQIEESLENLEKAQERNREEEKERINQLAEDIARETADQYSFLSNSLGEVKEEVKIRVREAKEASGEAQIDSLRIMIKEKTGEAIEIFKDAIKIRLNEIDNEDESDSDDVEEATNQYQRFVSFGEEISDLAKGLRVGESTVEDIVQEATSNSIQVLERVKEQVQEESRVRIESAIEATKEARERIQEEIRNRVNQSDEDEDEENREENRNQTRNEEEVCVQVISFARDPESGECKQFSTPCEIEEGWEEVDSCDSSNSSDRKDEDDSDDDDDSGRRARGNNES